MAVIKIVPMPGAVGDKGDEGAPGAQGLQGEQGLQGPAGADALWSYNGEWQLNSSYATGDVVTYQGQLYYTKAITTAGTLPTDTSKFDLIAAKGADGEPGLNGLEGDQGPQGEPGADGSPGLVYLGDYVSGNGYIANIAVVKGADENLYIAKSSGGLLSPVANPGQWDLFLPKGANGADGATPFTLIGAYDNGAAYNLGIAVYYNGGTYVRTGNPLNPGYPPEVGAINASWTPIAEKGDAGSQLNYWNFTGDPGVPTENGAIVTDGLSGRSGGDVTIHATTGGKVVIAGSNGEFLFDSNIASNQIATIGDIQQVDTLTNGLVVTGQIDDETINPAGTMSLSVQDGYTALMDLVAHSATFNGDIQVTNLSGTRNTTIETPTTINNELTIQTEYGEGWTFDNNGYILGPWLSAAEDPGNSGRYLRVNGITRADNNPLLVSSSGPILINGTGGEFLNFHGDQNNQIATIGDFETAYPETDYTVGGGTDGTQPTFTGNPLFFGSYTKTANLVHFRVNVQMTNITNFGTGNYYITLPHTAKYDTYMRNGHLRHSSGDIYAISGHVTAGTNVLTLYSTASNGKEVRFTPSVPVGLNTTCDFHIFGSYFSA